MSYVLVCGGRDYDNRAHVFAELDQRAEEIQLVIDGGCPTGADAHARAWADLRGVASVTFNAAWTFYKLAAGPIRNGWMLHFIKPDFVLAFPGGRGTANMVSRAEAASIPVTRPSGGSRER